MPDKKNALKSKVTINTISETLAQSPTSNRLSSARSSRSSYRSAENENEGPSRRSSSRNKRTRSSAIDANIESINLQESPTQRRPITLKASFLRRKMREYEGNCKAKYCYQFPFVLSHSPYSTSIVIYYFTSEAIDLMITDYLVFTQYFFFRFAGNWLYYTHSLIVILLLSNTHL